MLRATGIGVLTGLVLGLAGCEGDGRTNFPPASKPTSAPTSLPAAGPVTSTPSESQPSGPIATMRSTSEPTEPELPDYLTIIAPIRAEQAARARVLECANQRLVVETRNVQRLRIERSRLPLNARRSIALVLDGQSLEWLARSKVEEFVRSPNGVWLPVEPSEPTKP